MVKLHKVLAWSSLLVVPAMLFGGCVVETDSSGGGTGAVDAGTGGSSAAGGAGGSGATGGTGECPAAPADCELCQDSANAGCYCETIETECFNDPDCSKLMDCVFQGDASGIGKCTQLTVEGAECVLECVAAYPAGGDMYLEFEKCYYCEYCGASCDTKDYCGTLDSGAGGAGGSGGAAGSSAGGAAGSAAGGAAGGSAGGAGGTSAGGTSAGGTSAGGTSAGGTSAGGTSAGGTSAGGTSAGGAAGSSAGGTSAGGAAGGG